MKTKWFKIPVEWAVYGIVDVEASSLAEAIKLAKDENGDIPLPDGHYIDGSWQVNTDEALINALNKERS